MSIVNRTIFPLQSSFEQVTRLHQKFDKLQLQLATGQKASNLSEMGTDRYFDLSLRARMGRIEGYQANIGTVDLRLSVLDQAISRLDTIEGEARGAMVPGAYGTANINFGTAPSLAKSRFDEVINLLNTDVDGRYMFGGSKTDAKPVEAAKALLEGSAGRAGFKQIATERAAADVGNGLGRVGLTTLTDTVTLAEDGDHPFGFKLSTVTSTSGGVTLTPPSGTAPLSASIKFDTIPLAGESITIGLTMPDGSTEGITLKGVFTTPGPGEFSIGGTPDATAINFKNALSSALATTAGTKLVAASNFAAADNFFNGHGEAVLRVDGPPFDTATALMTADPATTVIWYKGEDNADARGTATSRIDETASVRYGVQANESGLQQLVKSLAVVAIQSFPEADATSKGRFDAIANRNLSRLSESHNSEQGSIEMIAVELGNTRAAITNVGERQRLYASQLDGVLADIEAAPTEQIAMEILALQTRLQASYQATSLISQLSLANYLR